MKKLILVLSIVGMAEACNLFKVEKNYHVVENSYTSPVIYKCVR